MYQIIKNLEVHTSGDELPSPNGLSVYPLLQGEGLGFFGLYVDRVEVPPKFSAVPHIHYGTPEIIHVLNCSKSGVVTFYGPNLEYTLVTHANQIFQIDKHVPHHVYNPGNSQVIALRYSVLPLNENIELLPHLTISAERLNLESS